MIAEALRGASSLRICRVCEMRRVIDPSPYFLGFDLTSQINTYSMELSDHCLDLVRSQTALIDFKFFNATQKRTMVRYAIYAPAHHKPGKVQATAAAAEADKDDEPAAWSVQPKHAPDKHG